MTYKKFDQIDAFDKSPVLEKSSNRGKRGPRDKKYKISSSTGFKGVYYSERQVNHYYAQVSFWHSQKSKSPRQYTFHLGSFATPEEASLARLKFITALL